MRCSKCGGFAYPEIVYAQGYWVKQIHCIPCGEIQHIREPMEALAPERRTGRGRDSRKRQRYGMSRLIRPEDWILPNSALADRYGLATTTISHNRPNKRASKHHGKLGYPEIPSEAARIEVEGH